MTKIAMYTSSKLFGERVTGGVKRFLELYEGMKNKNIDVDLFCGDTQEVLAKNNVKAYSLKNANKSKNIFIPTELKIFIKNINTIRRIKKMNYDAVIIFDVPTAIGLCLIGIKKIQLFIRQDLIEYKRITISNRVKNKLFTNIYLFFAMLWETICLIRANKIFLQCKYDYNALINRHRLIRNNIEKKSIIQINNVNPSWIVKNSQEKIASKENIFKSKNGEKDYFIVFVGNFSHDRKGYKIFLEAIKSLLDKNTSLKAIMIGDGKDLLSCKEKYKNYLDIIFLGRLKNPIPIIKRCNLMVVPSLADSCPNTVMEALYNEIPVIGARSGGIPEILVNSDSLFDPDPSSLREKIEYYLNEDNLLTLKMQQKLRKKELEFDWFLKIIQLLELD